MSYHSTSKLSLNTSFLERSNRREDLSSTPGSRRLPLATSPTFSTSSSALSSAYLSSSLPQAPGNLPPFPIDSESFPLLLESPPNKKSDMYKVPGQNVFFVPYNSAPMGSHPGWTAQGPSPTYPAFPESNYYPGQPRTFIEDMHGSGQLYVVPPSGYETDPNEDDDMRHVMNAAPYQIESRPYTEKRAGFRPPLSISPANSSATDESGRSSSYGSVGSSGSGRSVRWNDDLVAPTPPPSRPRPKGWYNRRGDQLWCNDGRYKAAGEEYPHYLRDYPEVGEGWMNEHGVRISMTHRRMPDHGAKAPKGVLKNNFSPINF